jgi:hypothetical protein
MVKERSEGNVIGFVFLLCSGVWLIQEGGEEGVKPTLSPLGSVVN